MDMRDYSTLHLDINLSKGTALLLLFCILYFCFEGTIGVNFMFVFLCFDRLN